MATKEYFCKVSCGINDIIRKHANITTELDLTDYSWVVNEAAMKALVLVKCQSISERILCKSRTIPLTFLWMFCCDETIYLH